MKPTRTFCLASLAFAAAFLGAVPTASAFPRTRETAQLSLSFDLQPTAAGSGVSEGTATIDLTRKNGVSTTTGLQLSFTNLADGTYSVDATLKSDSGATPVNIGSVTITGSTVDPSAPLSLPTETDPLDFAAITISDATSAVVLSGSATETITSWTYFGNKPLLAPPGGPASAKPDKVHGKPVKVHGHIVIQARIRDGVEKRRKFLLVGLGLPADAALTVNVDGVAVGSVTTTPRGKAMLKSLPGDFRLAGVDLITLTDSNNVVVAQADFFPDQD
jgi:hypothetical protein